MRLDTDDPMTSPPGLLLGWHDAACRAPLGLKPRNHRPAAAGPEPLWYTGDAHLLTIAPTGAGKGRGVLIPNLLLYPGPVLCIDPKGELYHVTARRRREMGQAVYVLDPFHVATGHSDGLNPLDLLRLPGAQDDCDAEMLAGFLAVGHEIATDRFWNDTATGLISGLIAHTAATAAPAGRNLNALRRLLHQDDLDYTLAKLLDANGAGCPLARDEFVAYLNAPSDKTRPCILSTAQTYLKALGSRSVAAALERSTFDLEDFQRGKPMTIYLIIPPEKLETHRSLLRLWVGTFLAALARRTVIPPRRTLVLLDECAQLGTFPPLRQAITLLRGYGVQVWSCWQDLSQLKLLYPQDWPTLINNAAVVQAFGLGTYLLQREWAEIFGEDPATLARLRATEAAVSQHGQGLHLVRRPDYLADPLFAGGFDANPRFAAAAALEGACR